LPKYSRIKPIIDRAKRVNPTMMITEINAMTYHCDICSERVGPAGLLADGVGLVVGMVVGVAVGLPGAGVCVGVEVGLPGAGVEVEVGVGVGLGKLLIAYSAA
jgi:hypothetical protein